MCLPTVLGAFLLTSTCDKANGKGPVRCGLTWNSVYGDNFNQQILPKICLNFERIKQRILILANIVFTNMLGKFIFSRTSGKPGENDEPTAPAVT